MGKRALSVDNVLNQKHHVLEFENEWRSAFGTPEVGSRWLIWGGSGSGKTRLALMLAKYLCRFHRVAYNSLEEGNSFSMQRAIREVGMQDVRRKFIMLDREPIEDMTKRLKAHKAPRIAIIDSLQYTGMTYRDYIMMCEELPGSMLIFVSHADGKEPEGRVAKRVRFDAGQKIRVEGFRAFTLSRYGGGELFTISDERAQEYWGLEY